MKIREITSVLEEFAPLRYQESYDNAGLIVGREDDNVESAIICVDATEEVMDEAERLGAGLIISHHPIIFHPIKRLNSASNIERVVERAIKTGTALYACHTNLDSTPDGMSFRLATQLGIKNLRMLEASVPNAENGFGVIGNLPNAVNCTDFMRKMKEQLNVGAIRHNRIIHEKVKTIALCTGAGASLIDRAAQEGAELYIAADFKYNDFLDTEGRITVADIGHFESEYCAIDLIFDVITKKLPTFALHKSKCSHNPVYYLI